MNKLTDLKSSTISEEAAVASINENLKYLGNQSFTLYNYKGQEQEGHYQIRDYNNSIRALDSLSTGEKNLIAFLWFIYDIDNLNKKSEKEMILVFDDPMNSNDDTVQYLIISHLQKLLRKGKCNQIFILTHNVHFYINTRYGWWKKDDDLENKTTLHLLKSGEKSKVKLITSKKEDIKSSYHNMWLELKWLYEYNQPTLMINPIRRIFETFGNFNCINNIYGDDIEARKLFNVNSHSIDDFEAELNGKNRNELIKKVEKIFEINNAKNHFKNYWNK